MKAEELRAIQAPIKELYRNNPESAIVTLKAEGNLGENVSCKVETGKALREAGLHRATGGSGLLACSGDMLLEALIACAGVTLGAVATSMGIELKSGVVKAEGDLDFRGTLGVSKEVPVGFKEIRLNFIVESPAPEEQIQKLIQLTERYCVVFQTISNPCKVDVSYNNITKTS
jgi:uncharacterized OsmC-like protein